MVRAGDSQINRALILDHMRAPEKANVGEPDVPTTSNFCVKSTSAIPGKCGQNYNVNTNTWENVSDESSMEMEARCSRYSGNSDPIESSTIAKSD